MGEAQGKAGALQAILDRAEIKDLFVRYYSGLGAGDHDWFGQFFTDDAELDVNGIVVHGRDGVAELYRQVAEDKPNLVGTFRMILSNLTIELRGDKAIAHALWTQTLNDTIKGPQRFIEQGREVDLMVRTPDGWRIAKRVVTADSNLPDMMDETYTPRKDYALSLEG